MNMLACALFAAGALVILANWHIAARYWLRRKRGTMVPLFGGLLAAVGMMFSAWEVVSAWAWLAPVFDLGVWMVLLYPAELVRAWCSARRKPRRAPRE